MEHVTFDEFFDFVKNEDADWYIPGLKEYFEGLNQDEIYIQDNFLGKLVFQFNKFENNLKKAVFDKFICYKKMMDEKEKNKAVDETVLSICEWIQGELKESGSFLGSMMLPAMVNALANLVSASADRYEPVYQRLSG